MEFLIIGVIVIFILIKNNKIDTNKFIRDNGNWVRKLKESDYEFYARTKYGANVDIDKLFDQRVKNAFIVIVALMLLFITQLSLINVLLALIAGYFVFKNPYSNLKSYYKRNLQRINSELPYFLKNLEVLAQHYTIPVALAKSIETSPEVFKDGLTKLVQRINEGDSSIEPYMEFARNYPVTDSMRMMRLLYRLGLGSQENKHEQLIMFSKGVSALQNKAREMKYKERLNKMENQTMLMLGATGGSVMILMLLSILQSMNA